MKKIFLFLVMAILSSGIAMAQNANRHGFFLELGIGGLVGDTPRSSISVTDNTVKYKCLSGGATDFGLGGRVRLGNHWAYEIKAEAQIPFANPIHSLVGRGLPIGFRYTSIEVWRNYSLYAHANVGGAIIVNRGMFYGNYNSIFPNTGELKLKRNGHGEEGYGISYSAGVGLNITTHIYAEACYNGQAMFDSFGKNGIGMNNFGIIAILFGYRF